MELTMKIYADLLMIAAIWVFVLDVSGFWQEFSSLLKRWVTKGAMSQPFDLKPFSCSLCMTFWTGLAYLVVSGSVTVGNMAYVCLMAYLTPTIKDLLWVVRDLMAALFNKITPKR